MSTRNPDGNNASTSLRFPLSTDTVPPKASGRLLAVDSPPSQSSPPARTHLLCASAQRTPLQCSARTPADCLPPFPSVVSTMSFSNLNVASKRNNPFGRSSASPSAAPQPASSRPKSAILTSPPQSSHGPTHSRTQSYSPLSTSPLTSAAARQQPSSNRNGTPSSNTFAPQFIKSEEMQRGAEQVKGIEGENDFSGRRYVWLKDPEKAFTKGWVIEELQEGPLLVQCEDGSVCLPSPVL